MEDRAFRVAYRLHENKTVNYVMILVFYTSNTKSFCKNLLTVYKKFKRLIIYWLQLLIRYFSVTCEQQKEKSCGRKRTFPLTNHTEKNLFLNFTLFIRKFIIFIVVLGHTKCGIFMVLNSTF